MSHRLTTSTNGDFVNTGKYELETLPHPITPVRMRPALSAAAARNAPDATTALPRSVVLAKLRRLTSFDEVFITAMYWMFSNLREVFKEKGYLGTSFRHACAAAPIQPASAPVAARRMGRWR